jgi:hypothetical protein
LRTLLLSQIVDGIWCAYWLQWAAIGVREAMAGPEDPNGGAALPPAGKAETLTYVCDIIGELKQLADKAGYRTLAAILGAAHIEARQQKDAHTR